MPRQAHFAWAKKKGGSIDLPVLTINVCLDLLGYLKQIAPDFDADCML
jgi:hypothetical protein